MRVYIAGPYTAGSSDVVALNVLQAITAGERIAAAGCDVAIPHLMHYWNEKFSHPYEFWMKQAMSLLKTCDCMVVVGRKSEGVLREIEEARVRGVKVYFGVQEFLDDLKAARDFAAKQFGIITKEI